MCASVLIGHYICHIHVSFCFSVFLQGFSLQNGLGSGHAASFFKTRDGVPVSFTVRALTNGMFYWMGSQLLAH